jgi:hypothetical protein
MRKAILIIALAFVLTSVALPVSANDGPTNFGLPWWWWAMSPEKAEVIEFINYEDLGPIVVTTNDGPVVIAHSTMHDVLDPNEIALYREAGAIAMVTCYPGTLRDVPSDINVIGDWNVSTEFNITGWPTKSLVVYPQS